MKGQQMETRYTVTTRDVDGGTRHVYKTEKAAIARFVEMSGITPDQALDFNREDSDTPPTFSRLGWAHHVSDYGCVVHIMRGQAPITVEETTLYGRPVSFIKDDAQGELLEVVQAATRAQVRSHTEHIVRHHIGCAQQRI